MSVQPEWQDVPLTATFALDWNNVLREPLDPHDEAWARERDAQRRKFTVVLCRDGKADRYVRLGRGAGVVSVTFLDSHLREATGYDFRAQDDGRLFLTKVIVWTYPNDTVWLLNEASHVDVAYLRPDGYSRHEERDMTALDGQKDGEITEYWSVPMDAMWEDPPVFGEWRSVTRYNRDVASLTCA